MSENNFENSIKEILYHHEEVAPPNMMNEIHKKRTPFYVLRNKILLNKYKLLAASVAVGFLLLLIGNGGNWGLNNAHKQNAQTPELAQQTPSSKGQSGFGDESGLSKQGESETTSSPVQPINKDRSGEVESSGALEETSPSNTVKSEPVKYENPSTPEIERPEVVTNIGEDHSENGDRNQTDEIAGTNNKQTEKGNGEEVEGQKDQPSNPDSGSDKGLENEDIAQNDQTETDQTSSSIPSEGTEDGTGSNDNDDFKPSVKNSKVWVSMAYGAGIGNRKFDVGSEGKTANARNASEKQRFSQSVDLMLNYKASENLEFFTGMNYFNRRENMAFERVTEQTKMNVTSKEIIEYHPIYGQRIITVSDTSYQTLKVSENLSGANSYKHVTVPLGVRWSLYSNDKPRWGGYLAANYGLEVYTSTKGVILDGDYNQVDLSENFSRTQFGNSFSIAGGGTYKISNRWYALFEPRVTFYLSPVNGAQYKMSQLDQGYTMFIGLKYGL